MAKSTFAPHLILTLTVLPSVLIFTSIIVTCLTVPEFVNLTLDIKALDHSSSEIISYVSKLICVLALLLDLGFPLWELFKGIQLVLLELPWGPIADKCLCRYLLCRLCNLLMLFVLGMLYQEPSYYILLLISAMINLQLLFWGNKYLRQILSMTLAFEDGIMIDQLSSTLSTSFIYEDWSRAAAAYQEVKALS